MANGLTRRELLKLAGLSGVAALVPAAGVSHVLAAGTDRPQKNTPKTTRPRNVIFMVADGMSAGLVSLTDSFSRMARGGQRGTNWLKIMSTPGAAQAMVQTYSLSSMVTDSAAAASAWGSGSRVNNRALNMLPDGRKLTTLAQLVHDTHRSVGLVTTCTITHATPAGFAVNQASRYDQDTIAPQYLNRVDVLLGGGSNHFSPETRKDKHDLAGDYAKEGYTLAHHRDELMAMLKKENVPRKLLGTFSPEHLPFTIDQKQSRELIAQVPTLAQMTRTALTSLSQNDKGFFLMVEGGKVDHCSHYNDTAGALWEMMAFDDAIGEALAYASAHEDTLIVITTDHGNSNPGLNGMGGDFAQDKGSSAAFARLKNFTASATVLLKTITDMGKPVTPQNVSKIIAQYTKLDIKPAHADALARRLNRKKVGALNRQHENPVGVLGEILSNYIGVGWTGISHTADYATLSAIGPGASHFQGFGKNTDAFRHITSFFDINFTNPGEKPQEPWRA